MQSSESFEGEREFEFLKQKWIRYALDGRDINLIKSFIIIS